MIFFDWNHAWLNYQLTHMFWPTPGRSATIETLFAVIVGTGPIPDTMSNCGERNWSLRISVCTFESTSTFLYIPLQQKR